MKLEALVQETLAKDAARRAEKERDERSRSHVRVGTTVGGRRIMDRPGNPGRALCGGELTSYDTTLPEARRMAKKGELEKWVGCAACREQVAPTPAHVKFGSALAREFFSKRGKGNNVEVHLSELELAALLALAFEEGQKRGSR